MDAITFTNEYGQAEHATARCWSMYSPSGVLDGVRETHLTIDLVSEGPLPGFVSQTDVVLGPPPLYEIQIGQVIFRHCALVSIFLIQPNRQTNILQTQWLCISLPPPVRGNREFAVIFDEASFIRNSPPRTRERHNWSHEGF